MALIGAKDAIIHRFTNLDNKLRVWTQAQDVGS